MRSHPRNDRGKTLGPEVPNENEWEKESNMWTLGNSNETNDLRLVGCETQSESFLS